MRVDRALYLCLLALLLIGALALALGGESLGFALATVVVCVGNWLWERSERRVVLPDWLATVICMAAFVVTLFRVPSGPGPLGLLYVNVPRAGEFLLGVQWVLLFRRKRARDFAWLFLISFILVVCCSLMVSDIQFVIPLVLLIFVGQCALSLLHLYTEGEHARPWRPARAEVAPRTVGLPFLRRRLYATAALMVPTALLFAAAPRGRPGGILPTPLPRPAVATAVTGFSDTVSPGDIGTVMENVARVMEVSVTVEGAKVGADYPLLLRGTAFTLYDGRRWSTSGHLDRVWRPDELRRMYDDDFSEYLDEPGSRVRCDIWLEPLDTRILFAPFALESVELVDPRQLRINARTDTVETRLLRRSRLHYRTVSRDAPPSERASRVTLDEAVSAVRTCLDLPPNISRRVRSLARRIADSGPDRSPLAVALRIESYLRDSGNFQYSLDVPVVPEDAEPVDSFLFEAKRGYCEHYASAMAVLLRCVDIPARLAAGFKGGTWNSVGEYFTVRQSDAHSWVEAYVVPYGWVTFDPTGASEGQRRPKARSLGGLRDFFDFLRSSWVRHVVGYDYARQAQLWSYANAPWRWLGENLRGLLASRDDSAAGEPPSTPLRLKPVVLAFAGVILGAGVASAILLWKRGRRRTSRQGLRPTI
jgi:transglutaminase-like putative cysteine protease